MDRMTFSEALTKMEEVFPGKYVTAAIGGTRYSAEAGGNRKIEYSLYVEGRQHYTAFSFEGCFAQIPEANPATDAAFAQADADTADAGSIGA